MKRVICFFLSTAVFFSACAGAEISLDSYGNENPEGVLRSVPFEKGANFSGWFEAQSPQGIPFSKYGEQDFADFKSIGGEVIRLPIRMHSMTLGPPDYVLDPLYVRFISMAADWAEKYEIYLIIDNHSFDPESATEETEDEILLPVWANTAELFKERSDYILYEILNEPHGISHERWGEIQGMAIDVIRNIDQKHAIIVGGADWNSIDSLFEMPHYSDPNVIYTFHFYDPFLFTHQGASWAGELYPFLKNVPFPADKKRMPKIPKELKGTWLERSLKNAYPLDAAPSKLFATLDKVVEFSRERDVPVFCGEFGVLMNQSPPQDRVRWYEFITGALSRRNIPRTSWDYHGGFGIFNRGSGGDFNTDLNTGVVRALGFTPPPQGIRQSEQVTTGFVIYDDFLSREFYSEYWGEGEFTFFDSSSSEGEFAIRWSNAARYNSFSIKFNRKNDLSLLAEEGYCLQFDARAEKPVRFDVRFQNPENVNSIPWRMHYPIDESILPPDGEWHTIRIPLGDMYEHGAWITAREEWVDLRGEFTWGDIDQLMFAIEEGDLKNNTIWLDAIVIGNF